MAMPISFMMRMASRPRMAEARLLALEAAVAETVPEIVG